MNEFHICVGPLVPFLASEVIRPSLADYTFCAWDYEGCVPMKKIPVCCVTPCFVVQPPLSPLTLNILQGRSDVGVAKVHGFINGQYVAGDVRLRRIAHYHPDTGQWTGVKSNPPPPPVKLSTVSKVCSKKNALPPARCACAGSFLSPYFFCAVYVVSL